MVKLIVGLKGSGKTKALIEMVNAKVNETPGSVVCLEKGGKLIHEINYQAIGNAMNIAVFGFEIAHDINIAEQVQRAEKEVRERRKYGEVYVQILEKYLETGKLPDGTVEIIHLVNPKIEKRNRLNIIKKC